jgi:hypothetical protein
LSARRLVLFAGTIVAAVACSSSTAPREPRTPEGLLLEFSVEETLAVVGDFFHGNLTIRNERPDTIIRVLAHGEDTTSISFTVRESPENGVLTYYGGDVVYARGDTLKVPPHSSRTISSLFGAAHEGTTSVGVCIPAGVDPGLDSVCLSTVVSVHGR